MRGWLVALLVIAVAIPTAGCIRDVPDPGHPNRLHLRSIDVAAPHVSSGSVTLLVNTSLDNANNPSDQLHVVVKAFNTNTGFLVETKQTDNVTLPKDTTRTVPVRLDVPREAGYRIEVEVYEHEQLSETGRVTVHNLDALEPTTHETGLSISTIEVLVRNVSGTRVDLEVQPYLTNEADTPSDPLRMQIKARDIETGLLADERFLTIGPINPEHTQIEAARLTVPNHHNYRLDIAVWDENFIVERGQDTVQLAPQTIQNTTQEIVVSDPHLEDFIRPEDGHAAGAPAGDGARADVQHDANEAPTPGLLTLLATGGLAAAATATLSHRRTR